MLYHQVSHIQTNKQKNTKATVKSCPTNTINVYIINVVRISIKRAWKIQRLTAVAYINYIMLAQHCVVLTTAAYINY